MADEKAVIYKSLKEAQYDATAKMMLAQKPFLANILVHTVKEFIRKMNFTSRWRVTERRC